MFKVEEKAAVFIPLSDLKAWCARLFVPNLELAKIAPCAVFKGLKPIFQCGGLPIVAINIKLNSFVIGVVPDEGFQHADKLGTFFINSRRVEIVDLNKAVWANRMCEGAVVFGELRLAQNDRIFDLFN